MLVHGHSESAGHHRWDWVYFVAAGVAIAAPSAALPFAFPVHWTIAGFASIIVVLRGIWWGWRRGRVFLALGTIGLVVNSTVVYEWVRFYQYLHRPRTTGEIARDQQNLHVIVRTLEYAKRLRGEYPHTLQQLEEWIPSVYFADLWDPTSRPGCLRTYPGYVRSRDGSSYELFGIGPDCTARTTDDVLVSLPPEERALAGLLNPR